MIATKLLHETATFHLAYGHLILSKDELLPIFKYLSEIELICFSLTCKNWSVINPGNLLLRAIKLHVKGFIPNAQLYSRSCYAYLCLKANAILKSICLSERCCSDFFAGPSSHASYKYQRWSMDIEDYEVKKVSLWHFHSEPFKLNWEKGQIEACETSKSAPLTLELETKNFHKHPSWKITVRIKIALDEEEESDLPAVELYDTQFLISAAICAKIELVSQYNLAMLRDLDPNFENSIVFGVSSWGLILSHLKYSDYAAAIEMDGERRCLVIRSYSRLNDKTMLRNLREQILLKTFKCFLQNFETHKDYDIHLEQPE